MIDRISKAKPYILIALIDAMMTQIYIDLLTENFRISVAVLILPVIYFFNRRVNPMVASVYIGLFGLLTRTVIGMGAYGTLLASFLADYQILFFDLTYGLIYYLVLYKRRDYDMTRWLIVVLAGDLIGNIVELFIRTGWGDLSVFSDQIYILLYVAIFRTIVAILIVAVIRSYRMFILKAEHNKRYQQLLLRISDLESELYFINRNMTHIEDVMYEAYDLYEGAATFSREEISRRSLGISTDIHEIKKNYVNIYNGIREITEKDKDQSDLRINDLMSILFKSLHREAESHGIQLKCHINSQFKVHESYYFLTIVRNIVVNGMEALKNYPGARKAVTLYETRRAGQLVYRIIDNGPGIDQVHLDEVFSAGFSTKYAQDSGEANRGLGLYIVRELVERIYGGTVEVRSTPHISTEFIITLPKERIEVKDEILHIG